MKFNGYVIFDSCAQVYAKPIWALNDAQMMRDFTDVVRDPKSAIGQHPEHYTLHFIGSFNDATAQFETCAPQCILTGLQALTDTETPRNGS